MLFRVDQIDLYLEFTEAKPSSEIKLVPKLYSNKTTISIKKVTFDDLLIKKETGQTRDEKKEQKTFLIDRRVSNSDSDLSARQALILENRIKSSLPSIEVRQPGQLSFKYDAQRKPIFVESEEDAPQILNDTPKNGNKEILLEMQEKQPLTTQSEKENLIKDLEIV